MHPTPLRGPKIGAILKVGANWKAVAIYAAARVMRKPLGGSHARCHIDAEDVTHEPCSPSED
jgi:hypothetical protein